MAVQIHPWCGDATKQSTKFSVTVDGSSADVYGTQRAAVNYTRLWNAGDTVHFSWLKFGSDGKRCVIEITRLAGAITSYVIYPRRTRRRVSASIVNGKLRVVVPENFVNELHSFFDVTVNNETKNMFHVFIGTYQENIPLGAINYATALPTSFVAGNTYYFPPGVYNIGHLFPVDSNVTCIVQGGAYVIGNFEFKVVNYRLDNIVFKGHGSISHESVTPEFVETVPGGFFEQIKYDCFYSEFSAYNRNIVFDGPVLVRPAFYGSQRIFNKMVNFSWLNPWYWGRGILQPRKDEDTGIALVENAYCVNADDTIMGPFAYYGNQLRRGVYIMTSGGCPFHCQEWKPDRSELENDPIMHEECSVRLFHPNEIGYWYGYPYSYFHAMSRATFESDAYQPNSPFMPMHFRDLEIDDVCAPRFLFHENRPDVNGGFPSLAKNGKMSGWLFEDVNFEYKPLNKSIVRGHDEANTMCNYTFKNVWYGDRWLTEANIREHIYFGPTVYGIKVISP